MKKVDKGFELIYWKLSYRRKFIRTLWFLPLMLLIIFGLDIDILIHRNSIFNLICLLVVIAVYGAQSIYTYTKWKKEGDNN